MRVKRNDKSDCNIIKYDLFMGRSDIMLKFIEMNETGGLLALRDMERDYERERRIKIDVGKT